MVRLGWACILVSMWLLGGCPSDPTAVEDGGQVVRCDDDPPWPAFQRGSSRHSRDGTFFAVITQASPEPPRRGANELAVRIMPTEGGARPDSVRMKAWMPAEAHGTTPLYQDVTSLVDDRYGVGPFSFDAPGLWELTFEATFGERVDEVTFAFCVADGDVEIDAGTMDGGVPAPSDAGVPDAGPDLDGGVSRDGGPGPIVCNVTAPTECPDPSLSYATVQPIVVERCVICHDGLHGQWALTSRTHMVDWRFDIRTRMLDCTMPPTDAGVPMTNPERQTIVDWIRCGMPE